MELMERRRILLDTPHISLQDGMQFVTDMVAPIESLVINFSPIQDLHGYDNPWPAGGGKNLCDPSTIIVGFWDGTGTYSADANYKTSALIPVEPSTNYTGTFFKADKTEVNKLVYTEWDSSENFIRQSTALDSFVTTANTAYVRVRNYNAQSSLITSNNFLYQFEKGSATSYAPYSNICPISGWTGANVSATGINIWDEEWEVGGISSGRDISETDKIRSKNYIPVVSGNTYFFYCKTNDLIFLSYYDSDKNYLGYSSGIRNVAVTMPERCRYIRFRMQTTYGTTYNHDISINYPSTDHDYHPYTGRSITINLGQTVYGGTLNVTTGVLTVDMAIVDMGTLNWMYYSAQKRIVAQINGAKPAGSNIGLDGACSVYKVVNTAYRLAPDKSIIIGNNFISNSYAAMVVHDEDYTDAETFKTAVSGHTLVYPIKTPVTYQLTPQQILALKGINNLSMSGQVKFWTHRDIQ